MQTAATGLIKALGMDEEARAGSEEDGTITQLQSTSAPQPDPGTVTSSSMSSEVAQIMPLSLPPIAKVRASFCVNSCMCVCHQCLVGVNNFVSVAGTNCCTHLVILSGNPKYLHQDSACTSTDRLHRTRQGDQSSPEVALKGPAGPEWHIVGIAIRFHVCPRGCGGHASVRCGHER